VVREFGKSFKHFVEVNFETDLNLHKIFERHFGSPDILIKNITMTDHRKITPGSTLVFFDEIHECPAAIKSLRYFKEKIPELHVVAAGSLLEFQLKELGFPVGRVEFMWMFPMNFEEFLQAHGVNTDYDPDLDIDDIYKQHLDTYLLTGGMPEIVDTWLKTSDLSACQNLMQRLVANYRADFPKYTTKAQLVPLRSVFEQTPRLWAQKIKYTSLDPEYRSRELQTAIDLLCDAGLITKCLQTSALGSPLSAGAKNHHFKLYSLDAGIGQRMLNFDITASPWNNAVNKGGLVEQFIAQEIRSYCPPNVEPELFFWHREKQGAKAELDFVISSGTGVIPIEVKSGTSAHHPSLDRFIEEKKPHRALLVSFSPDCGLEKNPRQIITHVPVWKFFLSMKPR